jgi:preprotein translocase subunit SecG
MAGGGAMGARRTADLLSKTTTVLAILFLSLSVLANFTIDRSAQNGSTIQEQAQQSFSAPGTEEINFPAAAPSSDSDANGEASGSTEEENPAQD